MKKSSIHISIFLINLFLGMGCNSSLSDSTNIVQEILSTSTEPIVQETRVETITPVPATTATPTIRVTFTPIDLEQYEAEVSEFKLIASVESDEISFSGEIFFVDDYAVELNPTIGEMDAVYDFDESRWWDNSKETYITFDDCIAFAQASADKTRETIANSQDEEGNKFALSWLEPNFIIEENEQKLIAKNDYLHYEVKPNQNVNKDDSNRIFIYSTMNACRKFLIMQQIPPFSELALLMELYDREIVPSQIILTLSNGTTGMTAVTTYEIHEMTVEESAQIHALLEDLP